jgi:uncharacterized protein YjbI with pentapeptide repeats
MQAQELLERYRRGDRNFSHVDLSGANLSGFNLREVDFTGAYLAEANLSWAFLNQAKLSGANLRRADLRNASLNNADLNGVILSGANLSKADLRLAQIQASDLNWAILEDADLGGANLEAAKLDQVNFERAKLNSTSLVAAELMEANLRRANLANACLDRANLRESHLEEANLREASLVNSTLIEANLSGAYLRQANLSQADLHRVILTNADLSEAILNRADLSRANLAGAYLLKSSFQKAHLLRANLQDVYLLRADLSEANLRGADLQRADLSGAYLNQTILSEADLSQGYLLETHLIQTNLDGAQLTGCCIFNWHVEELDFTQVHCRYVYTQFDYVAKQPTDRYPVGRDFAPGELGKQYEADSSLLELYFTEPVEWEVFVFTLTQIEAEEQPIHLTIKSYELLEDNYLVKVTASNMVNTKLLARRVFQIYPEMKQRLLTRRGDILRLLDIPQIPGQVSAAPSADSFTDQSQSPSPVPTPDKRAQLYKEVVRQIQHILVTQKPEQFVDSVQRLVDYLTQAGVSTEEIQKQVIGQAIAQRAKRDLGFKEHLHQWNVTASPSSRQSPVGQAVRMAITLLNNKH